jgi:hypothetical protein
MDLLRIMARSIGSDRIGSSIGGMEHATLAAFAGNGIDIDEGNGVNVISVRSPDL